MIKNSIKKKFAVSKDYMVNLKINLYFWKNVFYENFSQIVKIILNRIAKLAFKNKKSLVKQTLL